MNDQTTPHSDWLEFCKEIKAATARKPTTPRKVKPVSANGLTRQIVSHIRANGFFATDDERASIKVDTLFLTWFMAHFTPFNEADALPFGPVPDSDV